MSAKLCPLLDWGPEVIVSLAFFLALQRSSSVIFEASSVVSPGPFVYSRISLSSFSASLIHLRTLVIKWALSDDLGQSPHFSVLNLTTAEKSLRHVR